MTKMLGNQHIYYLIKHTSSNLSFSLIYIYIYLETLRFMSKVALIPFNKFKSILIISIRTQVLVL